MVLTGRLFILLVVATTVGCHATSEDFLEECRKGCDAYAQCCSSNPDACAGATGCWEPCETTLNRVLAADCLDEAVSSYRCGDNTACFSGQPDCQDEAIDYFQCMCGSGDEGACLILDLYP